MESVLTKNQKRITEWKAISKTERMRVELRYDDECGNGHNTFAITAETQEKRGNSWREGSGGCLHDEIEKHFPEYSPLIKWHLTSSAGPMHYIANTCYHASNRCHHGKLKGEATHWDQVIQFGEFPILIRKYRPSFIAFLSGLGEQDKKELIIEAVEHGKSRGETYSFKPKYTFRGFVGEWYQCPFDSELEAKEFLAALQNYPLNILTVPTDWSEGKQWNHWALLTEIKTWPGILRGARHFKGEL